jgi:PEP-CTERM motif
LTIANPPLSNEILLVAPQNHRLSLPGYGGTATVTAVANPGSSVLDLRSYAFYPANVFSGLPSQGLDPTGLDSYGVIGTTGNTGNTTTVLFDFTGLTNGYLPKGAVFLNIDMDTEESISTLAGFQGGQIVTPWLSLVSQFDGAAGTLGGTSVYAPFNFSGGSYNFGPNTGNSDLPTQYFVTTENLTSAEFTGTADFGPRGFAVAWGINVPEPATAGMAAIAFGGIAVFLRRRRG